MFRLVIKTKDFKILIPVLDSLRRELRTNLIFNLAKNLAIS